MLEKQALAGPTIQEWAESALSPETARAARDAIHVRDDGTILFDLTAPTQVLTEVAVFLSRLGVPLQYRAPRIEASELWDVLDDVLEFVRQEEQSVDIDIDGDFVHIRPGPAPIEDVNALQFATRMMRRRSSGVRHNPRRSPDERATPGIHAPL